VALDYGRRRIGIAVSDPTGTIASPAGVIELEHRKGRGAILPPPALLARLEEIRPSRIVMGIPLDMDGTAGEMAREVRAFAAALQSETGIEIVEWDERLTSARAEREIAALDLRRSRRREKGRVDEMAATLMLTDYLRSTS
jgi:putative Holliday junction resolvase